MQNTYIHACTVGSYSDTLALLAQYAARSMQRHGVRPSVCLPHQQRAAGLLLGAPRAGDVDGPRWAARRSAANASSVTLTAVVEG